MISTVTTLQTLPITVKQVAETLERAKKAKYDMATPSTQETPRAARLTW